MSRLSTIAALSLGLLLPLPLFAQFRAAPRPAFSGRTIYAGGFITPRPGLPLGAGPIIPFRPGPFRPGPFSPGPIFGRRGFGSRFHNNSGFGFVAPLVFPYLGYPLSSDYEAAPESGAPQAAPDNSLANEVANLADQVEALRQEQEQSREPAQAAQAGPPPEPESRASAQEASAPAVFVYRDGQQFEARNYAVLGGTLWVYEDQTTRKIPLAKLDLDQTRKLNDERGIDFMPEMR